MRCCSVCNLSEQRPVPVSRDPVTYFRIAGLPPVVYREAWAYWADGLAALAVLSSVIAAAVRKRIRLQRTVMVFLGCAVSAGVIRCRFAVRVATSLQFIQHTAPFRTRRIRPGFIGLP